jgi:hypothetical protein
MSRRRRSFNNIVAVPCRISLHISSLSPYRTGFSPYLDSSQIARNLTPSSCAETLKAAPQSRRTPGRSLDHTDMPLHLTAGVASLALPC